MFGKLLFIAGATALSLCLAGRAGEEAPADTRAEAKRQRELGNYKVAATLYQALAVDLRNSPREAADDLRRAAESLSQLNEPAATEALLAEAETVWPESWRVLAAAAGLQVELPALVVQVDGEYTRENVHWSRASLNAAERDRAIALRRMLRAETLLAAPADPAGDEEKRDFYRSFAELLMRDRQQAAWRLALPTGLDTLPDYQTYDEFYAGRNRNAPVGPDGQPVYYSVPASFDAAANDGERWRWALERMAAYPGGRAAADWELASFLTGQFGVQTMGQGYPVPNEPGDKGGTGAFAVRTLAENETIARLATGVKRFTLPGEFDFIALFRRLSDTPSSGEYRERADAALARIFENRQQYSKALEYWRRIARRPDVPDVKAADAAIARIAGNNGRFEDIPTAPAGTRATLSYLYRNGKSVALTAHRLDEKLLLSDIRAAVKAGDDRGDLPLSPEAVGRLVVERDMEKYRGEKTAEWTLDLEPPADHYSARAAIELPFTDAGCYLVEAAMADGNTSRAVIWLADLALVVKNAGGYRIHYVADAVSGEPVPGATLSFLGMSNRYRQPGEKPDPAAEFAEKTDADGLVILKAERFRDRQWLTVCQTDAGRLAYQGFEMIWASSLQDGAPGGETAFVITDRPVYRPDQTVNFKVWIGKPSYGRERVRNLSDRQAVLRIHSPMGETVYEKTLATGPYGDIADSLVLGRDAPLGRYAVSVEGALGGGDFRLEEYRKPEYEVTVTTPDHALTLGEGTEVTVKAAYYYGAPVQDARVGYKVVRTAFADQWFPPWRWDWLYGPGRWWSSYDYSWLPGWNDWNVPAPLPPWFPRPFSQPEVAAEGEGVLDADGVFRIPLDTAAAKEFFGDRDHQYRITVEVTDRSRRVITAEGKVVASRKPYAVSVWTNRGHSRVGEETTAHVMARLPLGGGVAATGKAVLSQIRYDASGTPSETEVESWDVRTDASGQASFRFAAGRAGQYRLSCRLTDADGKAVEGAAVVTVRGPGGDGDFRYAGLELVPDRREYAPGDTCRLAVNSENKSAVVLFLPRAERNGHETPDRLAEPPKPERLRLENGTLLVDVPVGETDQPNFFCEAVTVHNGKVHVEAREIFVPPAERTLTVEVTSDRDDYLPGGKAKFGVLVTDNDGTPVAGQCVVSLYDRAVEYISGGSNVGDIRGRFWGWKRDYRPEVAATLERGGYRVEKKGDVDWEPLGVFGAQEADWNDDMVHVNGRARRSVPAMRENLRMMRLNDAAVPMAAMPAQAGGGVEQGYGGGDGMAEPAVREEFADTALWLAALETGADGRAAFEATMPENLTSWKARVWTMGPGLRVGDGEDLVETRKNVIVRPQTPRFLTQNDQVVLSANLHNYLSAAKTARAELALEGSVLEAADGVELTKTVELAANGEARVDWLVHARRPGEARVVMRLLTDEESDAAAVTFPVKVHGARRVESFGGVVRDGEDETVVRFRVPEERLAERSRLEFSFSPTIASAMLEAIPFLVDYPYGCTEQTLNRFLPAVAARKYLDDLGLDLAAARKALEQAPDDPQSEEWRGRYGDPRSARKPSPVLDDKELAAMVKEGVTRLAAMQNADGGWGWFSGPGERSWPHTTAVVVHGLLAAREQGAAIPAFTVDQGLDWLIRYRDRQLERLKIHAEAKDKEGREGKERPDNLDAFIHLILAGQGRGDAGMRERLYRDRLELSLSGLAMLGLSLDAEKDAARLEVVLGNLEQYLQENPETGVAWLKVPRHGWWWWYNDAVETQAWYLKLLSRVDAKAARAGALAKYLLRNRKNGSYWNATRDTAYALEALAAYGTASGETRPDMTVALFLDGRQVLERKLTPENLLQENRFLLEGTAVEAGEHELRVVRSGTGPVYYTGALDLFSLEDPIAGTGRELKVRRAYYKLVREERSADVPGASGQAVAARTENYRRERMATPFDENPDARVELRPGDLVEVELTIETDNDYEYLVFEDMKAAGCEAVELRSGYTGNSLGAYVEFRDDKVVLFVRHLPRGVYSVGYRLRAESPGWFSALPAFAGGMYAPDLFANSDEMKVKIAEAGVFE